MSHHIRQRRSAGAAIPAGAFAVLGVIAAAGIVWATPALLRLRPARDSQSPDPADTGTELHAYLRDHLSGADAAITVVERMMESHRGTSDEELFAALHREFSEERSVVTALLESLGGSPWSLKRLIGQATGGVLQAVAGGEPGQLALFRTLESLAIGVQGKRLLWRAAQTIAPPLRAPGSRSFKDFEALALDQWERIDERRRSLALVTFGAGATSQPDASAD